MKLKSIKDYVRGYNSYRGFTGIPIIIGGCERSGTSLLQSIISAHHEVCALNEETWAFCYGPEAGFDSKKVIRISRLYKALGQSDISSAHTRWCEKSPANIFYFDKILDYFSGDIKLVHIIRDGRDVVTSMHPLNTSEPWVSINRWINAAEIALRYAYYQQVITIRYEDLIENHDEIVTKLCAHIGVNVDSQILDWYSHATIKNSKNLIGKKVNKLSNKSIRKFESNEFRQAKIVSDFMRNPKADWLLREYGYQ